MHGQSQNHVNNEINNFVHETIEIQSPVFEALESEMYDEFINNLYKGNYQKNPLENSTYIMTYNKCKLLMFYLNLIIHR